MAQQTLHEWLGALIFGGNPNVKSLWNFPGIFWEAKYIQGLLSFSPLCYSLPPNVNMLSLVWGCGVPASGLRL